MHPPMCIDMKHGANTFKLVPLKWIDLHGVEHSEEEEATSQAPAPSIAVAAAAPKAAAAPATASMCNIDFD